MFEPMAFEGFGLEGGEEDADFADGGGDTRHKVTLHLKKGCGLIWRKKRE